MKESSSKIVICGLKGSVNSNPEILSSFPQLQIGVSEFPELLTKCLPFGSKMGSFIINNYKKQIVVSYTFKITQSNGRDDLASISLLLDKKQDPELFEPILKDIIELIENNNLLTDEFLTNNLEAIFHGIESEEAILLGDLELNLEKYFKSRKEKRKPKLKGSFF